MKVYFTELQALTVCSLQWSSIHLFHIPRQRGIDSHNKNNQSRKHFSTVYR